MTNRYASRLSAHSERKTSIDSSRSSANSATSEAEETTISTGIRKIANQISAKLMPPSFPALRWNQVRR